jgi:hypothetical protein
MKIQGKQNILDQISERRRQSCPHHCPLGDRLSWPGGSRGFQIDAGWGFPMAQGKGWLLDSAFCSAAQSNLQITLAIMGKIQVCNG